MSYKYWDLVIEQFQEDTKHVNRSQGDRDLWRYSLRRFMILAKGQEEVLKKGIVFFPKGCVTYNTISLIYQHSCVFVFAIPYKTTKPLFICNTCIHPIDFDKMPRPERVFYHHLNLKSSFSVVQMAWIWVFRLCKVTRYYLSVFLIAIKRSFLRLFLFIIQAMLKTCAVECREERRSLQTELQQQPQQNLSSSQSRRTKN